MNRRKFLTLTSAFVSSLILPDVLYAKPKKDIYFTIDDGPKKSMDKLLNLLGNNKSTFFMIGKLLETPRGYNSACNALERGHLVGNHSYSHPKFSKISLDEAKKEIEKTANLLDMIHDSVGLENPKFFRFPYGDQGYRKKAKQGSYYKKKEIADFLEELGYTSFLWDFVSNDCLYYSKKHKMTKNQIKEHIKKTKDQQIVLAHELPITIKYILPYYINSGEYNFKLLTEL